MTALGTPTKNTSIGRFENNSADDIFQVVGPDSSVQLRMEADGSIDPPIFPVIKRVTLSAAQINGLQAKSAILIPAPGPGLYILPQSLTVVYNFKTTPYTITGADQLLYFGWDGLPITPSATLGTILEAGFVDQTSSRIFVTTSFSQDPVQFAQIINKALIFAVLDNLSGGDGTLDFVISYTVTAA